MLRLATLTSGELKNMANPALETYDLPNASPTQAMTTALFLEVNQRYGEAAAKKVRPLLREHNLDPASKDFDKQSFFQLLEAEMKA